VFDVMVENFAPGAIDRMGFPWEKIQEINPRLIYASVKGFGPGPFEDCKVYENVAQCTGGSASTTGELDGFPMVTGAQIGDSGTGINLALGVVTALYHREKSGLGQRVTCAMQDGVLNLCRVKLRDQQRLAHGPLKEYPQFPNGEFGQATPRAGNASGGGQPGWIVKCKGWETDPDAYIAIRELRVFLQWPMCKTLLVSQFDPTEIQYSVLHGAGDTLTKSTLFTVVKRCDDSQSQINPSA
jgi:formyl-CoA transferase